MLASPGFFCRLAGVAVAALAVSSIARAGENITYTYDELGRLVAISTTGTVNDGQSVAVTFDPAGNRTNYAVSGAGAPTAANLSIGSASVTEGGSLVFTVTRSGITTSSVSASYASAGGTATSGTDFTAVSGTVSFVSGELTKTIVVATTDDAIVETPETMTVTLSAPSAGAAIATATGTGTINDNDTPPSFAIAAAPSVTEGGTLVYTVTRTGAVGTTYTVNFASADGTAVAGSDYTANSGTLTFLTTDTSKTVNVATIDDAAVESSETVLVNISGASGGATITTSQASGTINDNDLPPPSFAISGAAAVTEGGTLVYTVTKTGATNTSFSVNFATANGTATAGSDYTANSGTLTFLTSDTSKTINVATIDDAAVESAETVLVNLSAPTGGSTITTSQGTGTINDNDTPPNQPPVAVADGTLSVQKCQIKQIAVTGNDTDPEGNLPITLVSVNGQSNYGAGTASVLSSSQIQYEANNAPGQTDTVTYTIQDSLGATSTGTLPVTVTNAGTWCSARVAPPPSGGGK